MSPGTILVVDDSPTKRYVICSWLRRAGYQLHEAATGAEALDLVHQLSLDLVVLDVRLPDADGFEVCEQIKADPRTAALPVIHVSAHAVHAADRTQGLTRGADAYLTEPIDPDELIATVQAVLRYYRARHRAERLADRLAKLVDTTAAVNAARTYPALLSAAAAGGAQVFAGPAAVAAWPPDGPALTAECLVPRTAATIREATARFLDDPLLGEVGTVLRLDAAMPWSDGKLWVVTVRTKAGRAPIMVGVPAAGFQDDDAPMLRQFGYAVAQAVDAMRSFDEERRIALTLQRSLLPRERPRVEGLGIAVRYLPASDHAEVGGDFYETVLVDGQLIAAIGDVAGHSLHAATVMGEVRHALRAFIAEGHGPGAVMDRLNRLLLRFLPDETATMCLLRLDPATGDIRLANAGHPSPMLVRDGKVSTVDDRVALLGVPGPHTGEAGFTLEPGDTLVFVTDGLIERRGHSYDEGLTALTTALVPTSQDLEEYSDRLLAELVPDSRSREDDIALLVLQRR